MYMCIAPISGCNQSSACALASANQSLCMVVGVFALLEKHLLHVGYSSPKIPVGFMGLEIHLLLLLLLYTV